MPDVVSHMRQQIRAEMFTRWGDTDGQSDHLVQVAFENLAMLVLTNPKDQPAPSQHERLRIRANSGLNSALLIHITGSSVYFHTVELPYFQ
jgi:hypothetical protein